MRSESQLQAEFYKYDELEDPAARRQYLAALDSTQPELGAKLRRLIAAASIEDSFLEVPALRSWRQLLSEGSQQQAAMDEHVAATLSRLQPDPAGASRFGPYELRRLLKISSESLVFEGFDPHVQRKVAIKCLLPTTAEGVERRDRILNEARSLARVDDPHVLTVLAVLEHQDLRAILLPWIEGPTLEELLRGGAIPKERAQRIALGLIQGVQAVHRAGIVHRDLKPANVVMDEGEDRPVIVDFGLAHDFAETDSSTYLCGTPMTMAPEVLRGESPSAAADRFSLGCTLYQLFTGVAPFASDDVEQVFQKILHVDPPAPSQLASEMPIAVERAIQHLLEKTPQSRATDLDEIQRAIECWASPSSLVDDSRKISRAGIDGHVTRRRWLGGLAIGGLIVAFAFSLGSGLFPRVSMYRPSTARAIPKRPPDRFLRWKPTVEDPRRVSVEGAVLTFEPSQEQNYYWRPAKPGEWGEVIYRVPLERTSDAEYVSMTTQIVVFGLLDLSAQAELFVRGIGDSKWLCVAQLGPQRATVTQAGDDVDVTDLCRRTGGVEIRARLYGTRELFHPGPKDHIGPATAQFLRDTIDPKQDYGALQFRIWDAPATSSDSGPAATKSETTRL